MDVQSTSYSSRNYTRVTLQYSKTIICKRPSIITKSLLSVNWNTNIYQHIPFYLKRSITGDGMVIISFGKIVTEIRRRCRHGGVFSISSSSISIHSNEDKTESTRKRKWNFRGVNCVPLSISIIFVIVYFLFIHPLFNSSPPPSTSTTTNLTQLTNISLQPQASTLTHEQLVERWKIPINLFNEEKTLKLYNETEIAEGRAKWPRRYVDGALGEELWDKIKHDVVICVKTGHEVAERRLQQLRTSGWWSIGRDIPNIIIISDISNPSLGIINIHEYGVKLLAYYGKGMPMNWFQKHGWRGDKDKNLPAFHLLKSIFPDKKWYILLDDDTHIFLENFSKYLIHLNSIQTPLYTGKTFYMSRCGGFERDGTNSSNRRDKGMFAHGGSGILLNRRAMNLLYPAIPQCIHDYSTCWAGDMQVGLCLRRRGIKVQRFTSRRMLEKNFVPFNPSKALSDKRYSSRFKSKSDYPITFHKILEVEERLVSRFEKLEVRKRKLVSFMGIREYLVGNGVEPAHTAHDRKVRWFSKEFFPKRLQR